MKSRYEIFIAGAQFKASAFAKRPSTVNNEWTMYELVEKWMRANISWLRKRYGKAVTKTNSYFVHITDTLDGAVASGRVYIQPPTPADADRFNYLGCFDSTEYFYASSLSGGPVWWKIRDCYNLAERRDAEGAGNALVTYTRTPPPHYLHWEGGKFEGVEVITAELLDERGGDR